MVYQLAGFHVMLIYRGETTYDFIVGEQKRQVRRRICMYVCKCDMLFIAQYWCTYCIYVSCNPNLHYSARTKFCMVSASAGTRKRSASAPSEKAHLETAKVCVLYLSDALTG